ncbi:hypothetical protein OO306_18865 [Pseudomonas sp. DCB_AW]|uniref:hypothetical protein n=1 Tax=Pseudomonas sp. DCB_AW TaxID=2993596 RepID=UPI0022497FC3|nr:hypothetical protein [Pseudomonas sp. DCB_AW]MCX2687598.1 hypothetical protein [Pseudomonas sp. DCB_AW]
MIRSTFTAALHCQYGQVGVVDTPRWAHPLFSADQDGWLCTDDKRGFTASFKPIEFTFTFVNATNNRLYYRINSATGPTFLSGRLEQNSNGWLGMYGYAWGDDLANCIFPPSLLARLPALQDMWKMELLDAWDGDLESAEHVEFYLRDEKGHRVAQVEARYTRNKPPLRHWFLHAGNKAGEILRFHLRNIKVA